MGLLTTPLPTFIATTDFSGIRVPAYRAFLIPNASVNPNSQFPTFTALVRIQRYIAILSVVLFLAKMLAWYLTHSVTVLTDALESVVNVVAGFLGLFSIIIANMPRDTNHPYGHGKAEFLSSAIEGTLIIMAGVVIIYEAV